jgi:hypothetical protein
VVKASRLTELSYPRAQARSEILWWCKDRIGLAELYLLLMGEIVTGVAAGRQLDSRKLPLAAHRKEKCNLRLDASVRLSRSAT